MRIATTKPYAALFGVALVLLGCGMVWSISTLEATAAYAAVGPAVFPSLVGGGMALVGLAVIAEAFVRPLEREEEAVEYDLLPVLLVIAGLVFASYALEVLGWVLTATVVFSATAWAFGNRRLLATALIGLAVASVTYLLFNYALELNLPPGVLGF